MDGTLATAKEESTSTYTHGHHESAAGWRAWAAAPDAWFSVLHGEIVCRT